MSFRQISRNLWDSIKKDILGLLRRKPEFNPDVFINPGKYSRPLPIEEIVADSKVSREGVEFYKKKIANNEKINPIIVVKHPGWTCMLFWMVIIDIGLVVKWARKLLIAL